MQRLDPTRRRAIRWAAAALGLLAALPVGRAGRAEPGPLVAAASDLQLALPEIVAQLLPTDGGAPRLVFGASGNLARQIRQGAPFELFLSADERFALDLARDRLTRDDGVLYALGRLALIVPSGSPLALDGSLDDLAAALADGRLERFAIANPEHAPYGRAAEQALRHKGIWEAIRPSLVLGENVAQAAQFATSGNAQGGIVARALAQAPQLRAAAGHAPIPAGWHAPLRQRMVLLRGAGAAAERLYAVLQEAPARALLVRHGLDLPDPPAGG